MSIGDALSLTTVAIIEIMIFVIGFFIGYSAFTNLLDRLNSYVVNKQKQRMEATSPEGIYKQVRALSNAISKIPAKDEDVVILLANFRRLGCIGDINGKTGSALVQLIKLVNKIIDRCETEDKEKAKKLVIEAVKRM